MYARESLRAGTRDALRAGHAMPPISGKTVFERPTTSDLPRVEPELSPIPDVRQLVLGTSTPPEIALAIVPSLPVMRKVVTPVPLEYDESETPTPLVEVDIIPLAIGDVELDLPPPPPPPKVKRTPTLPRIPIAVVE